MSDILVELRRNAAIITLNRPQRSNALSRALVRELAALGSLQSNTSLSAVVLTGAGDKAFCAGADLKERSSMSDSEVRDALQAYRELSWLSHGRLLSVAAINGVALGGGFELALCCDLRVCAPQALFALPETGLGIIPGAGGTQRLPRLIGSARALELILLGRRLSAEEALAWGVVNKVCDTTQPVVEATLDWLAPVLEGSPVAQHSALQAVRAGAHLPLEQALDRETEFYERCLQSDDRKEALLAFAEKRKPLFRRQ